MSNPWTTAALWLAHTAMGGGILLLIAAFLTRSASQPATRQRLAEVGVLSALLTAVLCLAPSWLVVAWNPSADAEPTDDEPLVAKVFVPPPRPLDRLPQALEPAAARPKADVEPDPQGRTTSSAASVDGEAWVAPTASAFVVLAYLIGAVCILCRWLLAFAALGRLLRRSEPVPPHVDGLLASISTRRPRLLMSRRLRTPISCGIFRPTIVLPANLCQATDPQQLRWIFAHELTHLARRDALSCLLLGLGQSVFFFVPWFWWLRRQVRLCQEYVADAAAVCTAAAAHDQTETDYAEFLLRLTSLPNVPLGATGVTGNSSDLFRRVSMLLRNPNHVEQRCPRRVTLLGGSLLISLAVLLAGLGLQLDAAEQKPDNIRVIVEVEKPKTVVVPSVTIKKIDDIQVKKPDLGPIRKLMKQLKDDPNISPSDFAKKLQKALKKVNQDLNKGPVDLDVEIFPFDGRPPFKGKKIDVKELRKLLRKGRVIDVEDLKKQVEGAAVAQPPFVFGRPRLGVQVDVPSQIVADQLDLPKGKGLVITDVLPKSPAAKAGLKRHDILLKLDGDLVSNRLPDLYKQLRKLPPGAKIDVVVVRKGKRVTVEELQLPGKRKGDTTVKEEPVKILTVNLTDANNFESRYRQGKLDIVVAGQRKAGKMTVKQITIKDDGESNTYKSLKQVPKKYRQRVDYILRMTRQSDSDKNN